jgi:hypothetical protein
VVRCSQTEDSLDAADPTRAGAPRKTVQRMIPIVGNIVVFAITIALLLGTLSLKKRGMH